MIDLYLLYTNVDNQIKFLFVHEDKDIYIPIFPIHPDSINHFDSEGLKVHKFKKKSEFLNFLEFIKNLDDLLESNSIQFVSNPYNIENWKLLDISTKESFTGNYYLMEASEKVLRNFKKRDFYVKANFYDSSREIFGHSVPNLGDFIYVVNDNKDKLNSSKKFSVDVYLKLKKSNTCDKITTYYIDDINAEIYNLIKTNLSECISFSRDLFIKKVEKSNDEKCIYKKKLKLFFNLS